MPVVTRSYGRFLLVAPLLSHPVHYIYNVPPVLPIHIYVHIHPLGKWNNKHAVFMSRKQLPFHFPYDYITR